MIVLQDISFRRIYSSVSITLSMFVMSFPISPLTVLVTVLNYSTSSASFKRGTRFEARITQLSSHLPGQDMYQGHRCLNDITGRVTDRWCSLRGHSFNHYYLSFIQSKTKQLDNIVLLRNNSTFISCVLCWGSETKVRRAVNLLLQLLFDRFGNSCDEHTNLRKGTFRDKICLVIKGILVVI